MTKARLFRVRSRLSKLAFSPGGITVGEALKRGDAVLETFHDANLDLTDQVLAHVEARFGSDAPDRQAEPLLDLYLLCLELIDLALATPELGLNKAAFLLCDFIDLSLDRGIVDWETIDLHLEAMRLLRHSADQSEAQQDLLLTGLQRVTAKRLGPGDATTH